MQRLCSVGTTLHRGVLGPHAYQRNKATLHVHHIAVIHAPLNQEWEPQLGDSIWLRQCS
jgi:hypothetical protein